MSATPPSTSKAAGTSPSGSIFHAVVLGMMAGGMGWGIRGQYGHETGAMLAGALVSWTLILVCAPRLKAASAALAVAWGTIAMGFGGSMTYGQTIGLTQNAPVIGNHAAWSWGMTGLALKGGLWIGFAGVFLGMALSGLRYTTRQILTLMLALVACYFVGRWIFNLPFDPSQKILPRIYFSADWRWEPGATLKPRPECWGGILLAWLATLVYSRGFRGDRLALRMALWGFAGGMVGFPLGQTIQSYHAWHPEVFQQGFWRELAPHVNWWNMMETTFGAVMGGTLGAGLWIHRHRITSHHPLPTDHETPLRTATLWLIIHVTLLTVSEFGSLQPIQASYDIGLVQGVIPMVAVVASPRWRLWAVLPVTALPIAGKTLIQLVKDEHAVPAWLGIPLYGLLPVGLAWALAWHLHRSLPHQADLSSRWTWKGLLFTVWLYFGLNFAFFRFPWPWEPWTARTPNALIFLACALGLTWACWRAAGTPDAARAPSPSHG